MIRQIKRVTTLAELLKQRKFAQKTGTLVQKSNIGKAECVDSVLMTGVNKLPVNLDGLKLEEGTREVVQYTARSGEKVRIYEMFADESAETLKRDKAMLEKLCAEIEKYLDVYEIPKDGNDNRMIIETTLQIIKEMLTKGIKSPKTHMYIAESNSKLCGALVGGLEKNAKNGGTIYAARKNATQNVTELNWTATWPQGNGVGKLMLGEYIRTMPKDGFKYMDIQSEIPELSYASKFYKRMGFNNIYRKHPKKPVYQFEYNSDKLDCLKLDNPDNLMYNYDIIPMTGSQKYLLKISDRIAQEYQRETFLKPVDTRDFIKELDVIG